MALLVILVIAWLAIAFGGPVLGVRANPTVPANPKPDWEFIWYFAVLASIPPASTDAVIILAPLIAFLLLLSFPLFNEGERHYRRRPWAIATVGAAVIGFLVLTAFGYQEPWHPVLVGLDKGQANVESLPAADLKGLNPLALQGAHLMQTEACLACHRIQGVGGLRGPDLTNVADRLSYNQFTSRIAFGGTNMPAYGNQLTGDQLTAIVAYLLTRNDGAPLKGNPSGP